MIFAEVGSYLFNIINLRKYVDLKPSRKYHYEIKKHIKPILIFFSQSMAVTIYTNIDTVMLGFMKGNVEVGLYNVAVKFKSVIVSLVTSLGSVLLPRLSYYIEKGYKEKFYDMLNKSFNTTLILSLPLSLFFIIFAKSLIVFVAGEEFIGAVNATQVILLTIPLIGLSNLLGVQVAVPFNKEKYMVIATCIGAIVDVVINYICIPMWGNLGAAIGTLVTELSVLVILIILLKEYCVTMIQVVEVCKIGCGTLCSCVVGYGLNIYISKKGMEIWLGLMIETIVFFAVYFVVLLLTREKMVLFYLQQFVKKLKKNN
jgi:O-antigen/teichoic acid export membrane protein